MGAINHRRIIAFLCLPAAPLVTAKIPVQNPVSNPSRGPAFDAEICPWYHLREIGNRSSPTFELVATCSSGNDSSQYRTSSLNLDPCIYNEDGSLFPSDPPGSDPGPYTKSCSNCGLTVRDFDGDESNLTDVYLNCVCRPGKPLESKTPKDAALLLGQAVQVINHTLGCFQFDGKILTDYHGYPEMTLSTTTITVTTTAIATTNITITPTSSSASSTSTTTSSTSSSTSSSSETPSTATVTKTRKVTKTHKVTRTQTVTETEKATEPTPVPAPSTVFVTVTPTHSHTIYAEITNSHFALFTTSDLPLS
ncbi:hypothetical protein F5Y05DRAFT_8382 [Hypoxylon sp. FL0543]|nr:hypothetical protein F5Y05DRAFT_8382 [Hypoxylon sp. FL0543]